jgi:hypothetical protein
MIVKAIVNLYRRFYAMPREIPDGAVMSHLVVLFIFFFTLGFAVSQVIIFLLGR